MKRVVFIHGWAGYPEEGWRPWLKNELEKRGWQVLNPAMPDTAKPTQKKWIEKLTSVIGEPDADTYLIGHSLGGITILRYLESLPEGIKIGGAILVAGFPKDLTYNGYKGELASFFTKQVDWKAVRAHCEHFYVLHSEDDAWVNVDNYHLLKDKLEAKGVLQNNFKHYSGDDGITELPVVLQALENMSPD